MINGEMEIRNRAGDIVDVADGAQLAAFFLERVPDPVTRSILFETNVNKTDDEDVIDSLTKGVDRETKLISIMRRVVNFAYVTALCRWKHLYNNRKWGRDEHLDYFKNARFSKLFLSAMGKEDITLDLQIFSLMELWVSLKKADDVVSGRFANMFATTLFGGNVGLTLQDVRDAIKNAVVKTTSAGKYTYEYCSRLCCKLLCAFPFLRAVKVTYPKEKDMGNQKDLCIRYALNFEEDVELYPNALYDDVHFVVTPWQLDELTKKGQTSGKTIVKLYLMVERSSFNGKMQYTYRAFDGEREERYESEYKAEHEIKKTDDDKESTEDDKPEDVAEVRKFLAFNYKNIREMALAISDSIKTENVRKKKLFDYCRSNYPKVIPTEITRADSDKIYWDNIITLLLVEKGPSEFLELLFDSQSVAEDGLFHSIRRNIGWRCIGDEAASEIKKSYDEEVSIIQQRCRRNRGLSEEIRNLRVRKILEAMNFEKETNNGMHPFEESLSFKYENILSCVNTLKQYGGGKAINVKKCDEDRKELTNIYTNVFKFLQIFYAGMDEYAIKIQNPSENKVNKESNDSKDNGDDDSKILRKHWDYFTEAAAKKYLEVENQTLSQSFESFCKVCNEYNSTSGAEADSSEKAKRLKLLITRNYICDVNKMRYFVDIELENGEKSTIFEMLENFTDKYYEDKNYENWLEYFLDLFFFLIYNEDYNAHGLHREKGELEDKDCDPIYPYLVTYYRENVDRDNMKKCTYRVPVPTGSEEKDLNEQGFIVNLLTEDNYPPRSYFCIPLKYGVSDNWWINPFLVPRKFVRDMEKINQKKTKK